MWTNHHIIRLFCAAFLLGVAAVASTQYTQKMHQSLGGGTITLSNLHYLDVASHQANEDLLTLVEVKSVLDVLGSAEIGVKFLVSAQIGVGQELSSLTHLVDQALEVSVWANAAVLFLEALTLASDQLSLPLFQAALVTVAAFLSLTVTHGAGPTLRASRHIMELTVTLFLLCYLVLPYALNLAGWAFVDHGLIATGPSTAETLTLLRQDVARVPANSSGLKYWLEAGHLQKDLEMLFKNLGHKVEEMANYLVQYSANAILIGIVFPLSVAATLSAMLRKVLSVYLPELETWLTVLNTSMLEQPHDPLPAPEDRTA